MTRHEFIKEIIWLYHEARRPLYPHERVFRGGSRSVASEVEDLFAYYLIERLPPDAVIYVNQAIKLVTEVGQQRIKPDLVVVRGETITAVLDLKMDLGYRRDTFPLFWRDRDDHVRLLRGRRVTMTVEDGIELRGREFTFGERARLSFVLVSDLNISRQKLGVILKMRETMKYSDLFILTTGEHPNVYRLTVEEAFRRLTVNEADFDCLEASLIL